MCIRDSPRTITITDSKVICSLNNKEKKARSGITFEWDTAAGHAIIKGVGGKIVTNKGKELKYGKKDFKNTNFVAKVL